MESGVEFGTGWVRLIEVCIPVRFIGDYCIRFYMSAGSYVFCVAWWSLALHTCYAGVRTIQISYTRSCLGGLQDIQQIWMVFMRLTSFSKCSEKYRKHSVDDMGILVW